MFHQFPPTNDRRHLIDRKNLHLLVTCFYRRDSINLSVFIEVICWAPRISHCMVKSTGMGSLQFFLEHIQPCQLVYDLPSEVPNSIIIINCQV